MSSCHFLFLHKQNCERSGSKRASRSLARALSLLREMMPSLKNGYNIMPSLKNGYNITIGYQSLYPIHTPLKNLLYIPFKPTLYTLELKPTAIHTPLLLRRRTSPLALPRTNRPHRERDTHYPLTERERDTHSLTHRERETLHTHDKLRRQHPHAEKESCVCVCVCVCVCEITSTPPRTARITLPTLADQQNKHFFGFMAQGSGFSLSVLGSTQMHSRYTDTHLKL